MAEKRRVWNETTCCWIQRNQAKLAVEVNFSAKWITPGETIENIYGDEARAARMAAFDRQISAEATFPRAEVNGLRYEITATAVATLDSRRGLVKDAYDFGNYVGGYALSAHLASDHKGVEDPSCPACMEIKAKAAELGRKAEDIAA